MFLFLLWVINLGLYFSFSLSLSLPVSLYSFCSGHNIDCDNGIFLGFALFGCLLCVTFVYSFYLQLCLFYFCLSGATILTMINNGIFLLVFALFVWVHVFPLSYCMCRVTNCSPHLNRNRKWAQQAQYNKFVREWVKELG